MLDLWIDRLTVILRFVKNSLVSCRLKVLQTLAEQSLESLNRYGIQLDKIRAQAYDGAFNISGIHMGAQAVVQRQYPLANYVHCNVHCSNVAITMSCNLPLFRNMMGTISDFFSFFFFCFWVFCKETSGVSRRNLN